MAIILPPTRALSQHLLSRSHQLLARATLSSNSLQRVNRKHNAASSNSDYPAESSSGSLVSLLRRSYATTTAAKPLGRPKGHTGRTPAKRKPVATKSATASETAKKPAAKKATSKKNVKSKPKAKPKPKPKPKPKKKAISLTAQKRIDAGKARDLKEKALLKPPKKLPETAWMLMFAESAPKGTPASGDHAKAAAEKYKNLSPEEHEEYNHTANQNKTKNVAEFKRWLSTYTPQQIKDANNARTQLKHQAKKAGKKTQFQHIKDERQVKRPRCSYTYFLQARIASGDMKNMKIAEIGPLVAREWKGLSASEKKTYEDQAAKDKTRYQEEYKSVYGEDPPYVTKAKES